MSVYFQPGSQIGEQNEARTRVRRPPVASVHLSHAEKEQCEEKKEKEKKEHR